ncbi:MAG: amidase [Acidimicrobiales bacterium]
MANDVRAGRVGARELVGHALERIEALNPTINAFVALDHEGALAAAAQIDEAVVRGEELGPLAGIPLAVKDTEDAHGFPTTHGSWVLGPDGPVATDSILVARLRAAGCIVVGKTNTPECAWKGDTENPRFGATLNPWDTSRSPGGSSGGTAAALAAGMVPLATGSDGGGSIRIPAALCGLSAMKTSLGRIPDGGTKAPDWQHLSAKGPMARTVADTALALRQVLGPDPSDLRALPLPDHSWLGDLEDPHVPMNVAWSPTLGFAPLDDEVRAICTKAVDVLAGLGAQVDEVESVFPDDPIVDWLTLVNSYHLRTLSAVRGTPEWAKVDPGLAGGVEWASQLSVVDLVRAEDNCHTLNRRLVEVFRRARLLVTPVTAASAPLSGEAGIINGRPDPNWVRFTYPFNMTRSPAATVCAGYTSTGLPVGIQLVGPQHGDIVVLRAAAALEAGLGNNRLAPV